VRGVDPQKGATPAAVLKPRPAIATARSVSGRIVDTKGNPVPDAVVQINALLHGASGRFGSFPDGLKGAYTTSPQVRGYRVPDGVYLETLVERDIRDLIITLDPAPTPTRPAAPLTR
jgi:hypothetical protein